MTLVLPQMLSFSCHPARLSSEVPRHWLPLAIGVPLALPIGILAGVLAFIPYLGSFTALGLALLMTMLDWQGWPQVLWVLGVHAVIQGLEGFVITPKIMGDTVGISAIAVLLALLVGAELLGFTGVLLAVPAAAVRASAASP